MCNPTCIAILWHERPSRGNIEVQHGSLLDLHAVQSQVDIESARFAFSTPGPCRLEARIEATLLEARAPACIVTVHTPDRPFSFFLRDVDPDCPILIPDYGVAVTTSDDRRTYAQIYAEVSARGLSTVLQRIEHRS